MSGVRPIEMNAQDVLSEQAPMDILHIHFCMAELLQIALICLKKEKKGIDRTWNVQYNK